MPYPSPCACSPRLKGQCPSCLKLQHLPGGVNKELAAFIRENAVTAGFSARDVIPVFGWRGNRCIETGKEENGQSCKVIACDSIKRELYVDRDALILLFSSMRLIAILVLLILAASVLAPFVPAFPGPSTLSVHVDDVCHSPLTGISPDLPFLSACPCMHLPLALARSAAVAGSPARPRVLAAEIDRPPEPPCS